MPNHDHFTSQANDTALFNWRYLWVIGVRHARLFLWCFVPVALLTIIYLAMAPRLYESTAVVQVEQRAQGPLRSIDPQSASDDLTGEDSLKTIEQNLQSYDLFVQVASNPAIAADPSFPVGYHGSGKTPADLAEWLRSNTTIALRHGTRLIDVTVDHQVPAMAQKLAQSIVDSFGLVNSRVQNSARQADLKFLMSESEQVKGDLQKSENSLQIYKDALLLKQRIDAQQTLLDGLTQRYREKNPQLIQARMLLSDLMLTFDREFKKVTSNSSSEAAYWAAADNELASASREDRIPTELKLVEARSQVLQKEVDTESALFDNILKQLGETDVIQDAAPTEIRLVEPATFPIKSAKPKKTVILFLGLALGVLLGTGAVLLTHVLQGSIETPMEAEMTLGLPVLGTIAETRPKKAPAVPEDSETQKPWNFNNFSKESWNKLRGMGEDILKLKENPKHASGNSALKGKEDLVVIADPGGLPAEGFRSLRAVIKLLGKASEHRTILFTSALPGEGKTFVSCNYALASAQVGRKTLLVDTDLRRPGIHGRFNLENKVGFIEMVTQDLELSKVVHSQVAKNLDILTAGGPCPNPAELLAGSGFQDLLTKGLNHYDCIIFDTSPVNLVSDCLLIASHVNTAFLVIRAGTTSRQAPQQALSLLRRAQKEPVGIILNAISPEGHRLYFGYKGKDAGTYGHVYS